MDDEYTMSWSDAVATEAAFLAMEVAPVASADVSQYGTLGQALWQQRCLSTARPGSAMAAPALRDRVRSLFGAAR